MNLNFQNKPEYNLNTGMIDELIRLYGTPVRFLVTEKLMDSYGSNNHEDALSVTKRNQVFGDFKTLKTDLYRDALEFYVLVSENEEYPNGLNFMFNNFGLINQDTLNVFVSLRSFESLKDASGNVHPKEIVSNLVVFPNNKVMEITDCQLHVPGVNNKFLYSNNPSCYQLSLKSYNFDRSAVDLKHQNDSRIHLYDQPGIDKFFEKQTQRSSDILEAATEDQVVSDINPVNDTVKKSKIDDVFGSFA